MGTITLLVQLLSWSLLFMLSRTLMNSSETFLIVVGVYFWMLSTLKESTSRRHFLTSVINSVRIPEDIYTNLLLKIDFFDLNGELVRNLSKSTVFYLEFVHFYGFNKFVDLGFVSMALSSYARPTSVAFWIPLILHRGSIAISYYSKAYYAVSSIPRSLLKSNEVHIFIILILMLLFTIYLLCYYHALNICLPHSNHTFNIGFDICFASQGILFGNKDVPHCQLSQYKRLCCSRLVVLWQLHSNSVELL